MDGDQNPRRVKLSNDDIVDDQNDNPVLPFQGPTTIQGISPELIQGIFGYCEHQLCTIALVSPPWRQLINEEIGRTFSINYYTVLNPPNGVLDQNRSILKAHERHEESLFARFQLRGIGVRKIRIHNTPPQGQVAQAQHPHLLLTPQEIAELQNTVFNNSLIPTVLSVCLTASWMISRLQVVTNLFRSKQARFELRNPHLVQSISVEYMPSLSLLKSILTNFKNLKELYLAPDCLTYPEWKFSVSTLNIPTLERLSFPIPITSLAGGFNQLFGDTTTKTFLKTIHLPKLKYLRLEMDIKRFIIHPELTNLYAEPAKKETIIELLQAVLTFLSRHAPGLEELVVCQLFMECSHRYEGLSPLQRWQQNVPGIYCIGEFENGVLQTFEQSAVAVSSSMKNLKTFQINPITSILGVQVNHSSMGVQNGPQAIIWQAFMRHLSQKRHVSVGIPGLPFSCIDTVCYNSEANLKTLQATYLVYDLMLRTRNANTFNCDCFRYCPNLEKIALCGIPVTPTRVLETGPLLLLDVVSGAFPSNLKEVSIAKIKLRSDHANYILRELRSLQNVEFWQVGKDNGFGVPIDTVLELVQERRLKRMVFLDSINGRLGFVFVRMNPGQCFKIVQILHSRTQTLEWVDILKDSRTGQYEQKEAHQFKYELALLKI
ncbi:unnamed protein product [Orchesella dallaii]|uniref:F-box domain-containing protein n=1 Tax=Orchesella dallaii TaxID=48710 RepID=A0ABP1RSA9_9HEXA